MGSARRCHWTERGGNLDPNPGSLVHRGAPTASSQRCSLGREDTEKPGDSPVWVFFFFLSVNCSLPRGLRERVQRFCSPVGAAPRPIPARPPQARCSGHGVLSRTLTAGSGTASACLVNMSRCPALILGRSSLQRCKSRQDFCSSLSAWKTIILHSIWRVPLGSLEPSTGL